MDATLLPYVLAKVHTAIQSKIFTSVLVVGAYTRLPPALVTASEKSNKPFNWQRPTAIVLGNPKDEILHLHVFPGRAYVEHYAALVATYVAAQAHIESPNPTVHYLLPAADACIPLFTTSNLPRMGLVDIVVLGYVDLLPRCTGAARWETGAEHDAAAAVAGATLFAWKKRTLRDGRRVAFVGCTTSYWGDIAGQLIRVLQVQNGVRAVVYVGKLGALDAKHMPNAVLGTGSCSKFEDGRVVEWVSVLERAVQGVPGVVSGIHCTVATSICETKEWLQDWSGKADWVDPEIGHMAVACVEGDVQFGYLHVVSDNLSREDGEGLADERNSTVWAGRMKLLQEVESVLERYFSEGEVDGNKTS